MSSRLFDQSLAEVNARLIERGAIAFISGGENPVLGVNWDSV